MPLGGAVGLDVVVFVADFDLFVVHDFRLPVRADPKTSGGG
jgi:hypothetical protein